MYIQECVLSFGALRGLNPTEQSQTLPFIQNLFSRGNTPFVSNSLGLKTVKIPVHLARTEGLGLWKQMCLFFTPFEWFVAWKVIRHRTVICGEGF